MLRILFVGAIDFSRHSLQEVIRLDAKVVGVITLAPQYASANADYTDLSDITEEHDIPLFKIKSINEPQNIELIKSLNPDVIFILGWSQLISQPIIEIPPKGCIGSHAALLPQNRGRHPLIWALVYGLPKSGLTFFYIDEGTDSGDILCQKEFSITLEDDAGTLYEKIKILATEILRENLPLLEKGQAPRIKQDHTKANYWRKRGEKDGEIDWNQDSMTIYNLIRALTHPYVGAHTYYEGEKVIVWKAKLPDSPLQEISQYEPGTVFKKQGNQVYVKTKDSCLILVDYNGKQPFNINDMLGE